MSRISPSLTRRTLTAAGGTLAIAGTSAALLLSGGSPAALARAMHPDAHLATVASASTVISERSTKLGKLLVNAKGDVLYAFSRDSRNKDACAAIKGCLSVWPIEAVNGSLKAGSGVEQKLLGTITVAGKRQATYDGHPLYGYVENDGPGDTDYVGISQSGGTWPAVSPTGKLVK